jgi:hypothetical protein
LVRVYEWLHETLPVLDVRPIYVKESLQEAGFTVLHVKEWSAVGLPVDIVLAKK